MQHFPHVPHYVRLASNSATVGLTLSRADRLGVILVAVSFFFHLFWVSAVQRCAALGGVGAHWEVCCQTVGVVGIDY